MLTQEAIERLKEQQAQKRRGAARMDVAAQAMCARAAVMREQAGEQRTALTLQRQRRPT